MGVRSIFTSNADDHFSHRPQYIHSYPQYINSHPPRPKKISLKFDFSLSRGGALTTYPVNYTLKNSRVGCSRCRCTPWGDLRTNIFRTKCRQAWSATRSQIWLTLAGLRRLRFWPTLWQFSHFLHMHGGHGTMPNNCHIFGSKPFKNTCKNIAL